MMVQLPAATAIAAGTSRVGEEMKCEAEGFDALEGAAGVFIPKKMLTLGSPVY
jgi:hypothetical protein